MTRKLTRRVAVGGIPIGGGEPVVVQSMLNTRAGDVKASVAQAKALEQAGCQIVRIAVPDQDGVRLIGVLKEAVSMPVVADIHFDYRLALESIAAGVDKIRINPGNIGSDDRVRQVAEGCKRAGIPIRIGVNSVRWRKKSSAGLAAPRRRPWWRVQPTTSLCWNNLTFTTSSFP